MFMRVRMYYPEHKLYELDSKQIAIEKRGKKGGSIIYVNDLEAEMIFENDLLKIIVKSALTIEYQISDNAAQKIGFRTAKKLFDYLGKS